MQALLLTAALFVGADNAGKPVNLNGTWIVQGSIGGRFYNLGHHKITLTFGEKKAEWSKGIPPVFEEKGTGTIEINAIEKPPTFTLKVGDKVY